MVVVVVPAAIAVVAALLGHEVVGAVPAVTPVVGLVATPVAAVQAVAQVVAVVLTRKIVVVMVAVAVATLVVMLGMWKRKVAGLVMMALEPVAIAAANAVGE